MIFQAKYGKMYLMKVLFVEISILELARLILRLTESSAEISFIPYYEARGIEFEDMPRQVPDVGKAERLSGFRAEAALEEGLQKTIACFRNCRVKSPQGNRDAN